MIILNNGTLRVHIAEPGEHPNDGVRFDRAGFITEVILNNERSFCANEPKNLSHPSTGGKGLCCEFKEDYSSEVQIGERYLKIGVGLIRKDDNEPYSFVRKYDIGHFPVTFTADETSCTFTTDPIPCGGYAVKQEKKISLEGNSIKVEYRIENCGEKKISTLEYCHNFLTIDGMAVCPDYHLEIPGLNITKEGRVKNARGKEQNLSYCTGGFTFADNDHGVSLADIDITGISQELPFCWKLAHKGARAHILGKESYTPAALAIWATDHMVSPEFMHRIEIAPGESDSWERTLTFVDELV